MALNAKFATAAAAQPRNRPLVIILAIVLTLLAMMPGLALAQRAAAAASRPTIVLVHGAWAGPAGWDEVVDRLHKDGYATSTPALGLISSAADVAIVRANLDAIAGDKILVGHSYGAPVGPMSAASCTQRRSSPMPARR